MDLWIRGTRLISRVSTAQEHRDPLSASIFLPDIRSVLKRALLFAEKLTAQILAPMPAPIPDLGRKLLRYYGHYSNVRQAHKKRAARCPSSVESRRPSGSVHSLIMFP